jgi:hypothetical protein
MSAGIDEVSFAAGVDFLLGSPRATGLRTDVLELASHAEAELAVGDSLVRVVDVLAAVGEVACDAAGLAFMAEIVAGVGLFVPGSLDWTDSALGVGAGAREPFESASAFAFAAGDCLISCAMIGYALIFPPASSPIGTEVPFAISSFAFPPLCPDMSTSFTRSLTSSTSSLNTSIFPLPSASSSSSLTASSMPPPEVAAVSTDGPELTPGPVNTEPEFNAGEVFAEADPKALCRLGMPGPEPDTKEPELLRRDCRSRSAASASLFAAVWKRATRADTWAVSTEGLQLNRENESAGAKRGTDETSWNCRCSQVV